MLTISFSSDKGSTPFRSTRIKTMSFMSKNSMDDKISLEQQMVSESAVIVKNVRFLEKLIDSKILEITTAEEEYRDSDADKLRNQLSHLLHKIKLEINNINNFMKKYRGILNEKENLLPSAISKKTIRSRSIPPNTRWTQKS